MINATYLLVLLTLCSTILIAQPDSVGKKGDTGKWNLVYANDENGKRVSGDLRKLIEAIRKGEEVRVGLILDAPDRRDMIEHFANARFLTIMGDSAVFAQLDPIVGQTPDIANKSITLKENIEWSFSASSLGLNDSMNTNKKTGEILNHMSWRNGIRWYCKVP